VTLTTVNSYYSTKIATPNRTTHRHPTRRKGRNHCGITCHATWRKNLERNLKSRQS